MRLGSRVWQAGGLQGRQVGLLALGAWHQWPGGGMPSLNRMVMMKLAERLRSLTVASTTTRQGTAVSEPTGPQNALERMDGKTRDHTCTRPPSGEP